ncbi:hypothetical protein EWF20_06680 [Sulfolobus sp. S-194]|uniref:hypothetical protein n=1 Tax=Sulfolobus sp. S-194 TaxID=2512240 RepID=UPI001436F018|nr:hypothetical protein [Sulfolobus sp. S-194]QIW23866.1 hypothetical protein EWF20_06680 [Sulfolobus sp. S-194]
MKKQIIAEIIIFSIYLYLISNLLIITLKTFLPEYFIATLAYLIVLFNFSTITKNRRETIWISIKNARKYPYLLNSKNGINIVLFIIYPLVQYILFSFLLYFEYIIFYPVYGNYIVWVPTFGSKEVEITVLITLNSKKDIGISLNLYYLLYPLISFFEIEYWLFIIGEKYGYTISMIYFAIVQTFGSVNFLVAVYQFLMNILYFYSNIFFIKNISKNFFILLIPSVIVSIIFGIKIF